MSEVIVAFSCPTPCYRLDQLLECAELCDIARIAAAVYEQCQTEDLLLSDKVSNTKLEYKLLHLLMYLSSSSPLL